MPDSRMPSSRLMPDPAEVTASPRFAGADHLAGDVEDAADLGPGAPDQQAQGVGPAHRPLGHQDCLGLGDQPGPGLGRLDLAGRHRIVGGSLVALGRRHQGRRRTGPAGRPPPAAARRRRRTATRRRVDGRAPLGAGQRQRDRTAHAALDGRLGEAGEPVAVGQRVEVLCRCSRAAAMQGPSPAWYCARSRSSARLIGVHRGVVPVTVDRGDAAADACPAPRRGPARRPGAAGRRSPERRPGSETARSRSCPLSMCIHCLSSQRPTVLDHRHDTKMSVPAA